MTTKLSFSEIKETDPIIFLYHAGSGGEFIAKTFAGNHPCSHPLSFVINEVTNQTHSIGPLHYASQWIDHKNPETWVNERFTPDSEFLRDTPHHTYVSKDHPTSFNMSLYLKHLPDARYVYLHALHEREFFARVAFAKLAKRIEAPVTSEYLRTNVNHLLTPDQEEIIIRWSNRYDWVWSHELMICNTKIKEGIGLANFYHNDSLDKYVDDHIKQDAAYFDMMNIVSAKFGKFRFIDIDDLVITSKPFWKNVAHEFPTLWQPACFRETEKWIYKNHKLLIDKRNEQI